MKHVNYLPNFEKMKKYLILVAAIGFLSGCKKEETTENEQMPTKSMPINEISIVNGMLSFSKAEFYDNFVSGDEKEVLTILRQYEENNSYLSLAEQREWAEDTVYTELISSLLNQAHMIHIENKVYRINAATGSVYTLPAEYINDVTAMTALKNENLGNDLISRHSVEEDLWEISGLPMPKGGPEGGCPTVNAYSGSYNKPNNTGIAYPAGSSGCATGWTGNFTTHAEARYRRYGIYFELYVRGWQQVSTQSLGVTLTCNPIRFDIPFYHLKINRNNNHTVQASVLTTKPGNAYHKIWVYNGSHRLCWFYMNGRTGSRSVSSQPWNYTPFAPVYFNYEP